MIRKNRIVVLYCLLLSLFQQASLAEKASRGDEPSQLILEFIDDDIAASSGAASIHYVSGSSAPSGAAEDQGVAKLVDQTVVAPQALIDTKHQLQIEEHELLLESSTSSYSANVEELINSVSDAELKKQLIARAFGESSRKQLDSAQLLSVANAALSLGLKDQALSAYRKAVELDPSSLSAHHALAKASDDSNERVRSFLKSVSTEALTSVADTWFEQKGAGATTIAAAMIPYQFAILKEPNNPYLRYQLARRLELAGLSYYALSTKRYLESAVLAKQKFLAGDKTVEVILRDSIESLIRTLAIQGDFDNATKYCHSYISLGYDRFTAGDSVRGILRKMQSRRNPFRIVSEARA